jgi:putative addiction module component (TIGR02574 family)
MHLTEIPQLRSATPDEKIELIDELWASIPPESVATPDSHLAELNRRMARLEQESGKALTPEEARARLRARTGL